MTKSLPTLPGRGTSGGDLEPSWGGEFFSRTKISELRFFRTKMSIFTAQIADDLFLVIDPGFRIFPFFYQIFRIFTVLNVVYDPSLTRETPFLFKLVSCFPAHPTTLLLKILRGYRCMGRPPTSNFLGGPPPSPP